ncbi:MAG: UDP-N-acetylmuramoyl-L-alanine--D-glutamate ligase [Candidatus Hydrothermota bacterium]|nr:MAG: UDP-N-acetylmuramoyl-L-alanine--D-glutamate ligase [Candidatus Hydrothermae bacterium]
MDVDFLRELKGKKVTVLGGGKSGLAAAKLLRRLGAEVFLSDIAPLPDEVKSKLDEMGVRFEDGGHTELALETEMIITSPGVPIHSDIIKKAKSRGIRVIGELELGFRAIDGTVVAITGTNGKSTVSSLIAHILRKRNVFLCGNIGNPLSEFAFKKGIFVLEVSSFQLTTIEEFRPAIAAILNIAEDHTDWHGSFDEYVRAKRMITKNQRSNDHLILNFDEPLVRDTALETSAKVHFVSLKEAVNGAFFMDGALLVESDNYHKVLLQAIDMKIKGLHNIQNALFAAVAAKLAGADFDEIREGLRTFEGLPHRLQFVDVINGVEFINDSKGTNPHAVEWALKGFKKKVILIMGGEDKGVDFTPLVNSVWHKVKLLIVMGKARRKLKRVFANIVPTIEAQNMDDAVLKAYRAADPGDTVLLSPGCASFDMFKNYKERGEKFVHAVKYLKAQEEGV